MIGGRLPERRIILAMYVRSSDIDRRIVEE